MRLGVLFYALCFKLWSRLPIQHDRFAAALTFGAKPGEEVGEKAGAGVGEDAFGEGGTEAEGKAEEVGNGAAAAVFLVARADDHAGDPGVEDGAGAHGTGLERDVERRLPKPPAAERAAGLVAGLKLGVAKGVFLRLAPVAATAHDAALPHDHAADGHLARLRGLLRERKRLAHISFVIHSPHLAYIVHKGGEKYKAGF